MAYSNLVPRAFSPGIKAKESALGTRLGLLLKTPETTISKIQGGDTRTTLPPPPFLRGSRFFSVNSPAIFPKFVITLNSF